MISGIAPSTVIRGVDVRQSYGIDVTNYAHSDSVDVCQWAVKNNGKLPKYYFEPTIVGVVDRQSPMDAHRNQPKNCDLKKTQSILCIKKRVLLESRSKRYDNIDFSFIFSLCPILINIVYRLNTCQFIFSFARIVFPIYIWYSWFSDRWTPVNSSFKTRLVYSDVYQGPLTTQTWRSSHSCAFHFVSSPSSLICFGDNAYVDLFWRDSCWFSSLWR